MKNKHNFLSFTNASFVPLQDIPSLVFDTFTEAVLEGVAMGCRVISFFASRMSHGNSSTLYIVLADDTQNKLYVGSTVIGGGSFSSLTPKCPQVHLFEREIAEQSGLIPVGHPWFKRVRYCRSWSKKDAWNQDDDDAVLPGSGTFYRVDGEAVHEVAVGPVHAGIIEPGHFRFQCNGEKVMHLEIALGYQHRGIENALIGGPDIKTVHYIETAAGDTTVGHTTCYCQIMEALSGTQEPVRSQVIRGVALELERLANHVGDLGALAGDTGFLPTASFCGRIRGDFLNLTASLCGNRFSRTLIRPGGLGCDLENSVITDMKKRLRVLKKETSDAVNLLWDNQSVMDRFEDTGKLTVQQAAELGLVGPAARACGLQNDARCNHPSGIYRFFHIPVSTCSSGDVFARAYVRWMEIQQSIQFIEEQLSSLPGGSVRSAVKEMKGECLAVSLCEGWRGEICHAAVTDSHGKFAQYKIVDPSFHNWYGLAEAVRNQEISDFPLCNKSFNLSYCGHDL